MSDSENEDQQEPKIIVDTDWKEQVAKEKEAAQEAAAAEEDESPTEIIVDTDWKEQVAKEKEAAQEAAAAEEDESPTEIDRQTSDSETEKPADQDFPAPPPASFDVLVSMLFTQALAMLGQMPDPGTGKATVNKPYAKHHIDTLEMLEEKTSGNLTDEETKILSEALHALRMAYVNTKG
jgi:hypothetical protein